MRSFSIFFTVAAGAALLGAQTGPQNVTGVVTNATLGKPAAGVEVSLLQHQGGSMVPVSRATTDSAGRYRFSQSSGGPFLVEVDQDGVPYYASVTAGQSETNLSIYAANADESQLSVDAEIAVLQPENGQLAVIDEYRIENGTKQTFYRRGAFYRFRVPAGATVDGAQLVGPDGKGIDGQPKPTADAFVYSLDYPFRPGETKVQIAFRVPYPGLKTTISDTPVYTTNHFEVYVPNPMTFDGAGFTQVGAQDGFKVFGIASGPIPKTLTFNVAGDAPMPTDAASGSTAAPAPAAAAPAPAPAGPIPDKTFLERNMWAILAILAIAAAAGFGVLFSQPRAQTTGGPAIPTPPLPTASPALDAATDDLKRLKDDLFLLEVRHHTGAIDQGEYELLRAGIRARMDRLAGKL